MAKQRGRRATKEKSKHSEEDISNEFASLENLPKSESSSTTNVNEITPFFGLIDSVELEYFKQAESTLNINAFSTPEERLAFIGSVFEESRGKELKLVTNQICSKLVERLILVADLKQMRQLFKAFNGHFVLLCNQKYSSHVMETFLVRAASWIEKQLLRQEEGATEEDSENEEDDDEEIVSMENAYLFMLSELKPNMKEMMVHKYASHVLRVILLILAGKQLPSAVESNSILRSKKSKIARKMIDIKDSEDYKKAYMTPSNFKEELSDVLKLILKKQDTKSLRELAIHPVASPVLQLLIQLEGMVDKERTFWCMTFGRSDDPANSQEEGFVEYLLSDAIGSHFFETAIISQRQRNVERVYQLYMRDRILKLAKRDTTGAFVVRMLLKKLKPTDQKEILDNLVPHLNELIVNNLEIGSSIVDCSIERSAYLKNEIVDKFFEFFNRSVAPGSEDDENKEGDILENVLKLSTSTLGNTRDDWPTADERRRALFLEKLIAYDQRFLDASLESLINSPVDRLVAMCKHGVFSHVVESCLDTSRVELVKRKRFLNPIMEHIVDLACNSTGSHVVDKLWFFTWKLNVYKDRIAKILFDNHDQVKNSVYGKLVWKNWHMELYSRRYRDWKRVVKEQDQVFEDEKDKEGNTPTKYTAAGSNNKRRFLGKDSSVDAQGHHSHKRHHSATAAVTTESKARR